MVPMSGKVTPFAPIGTSRREFLPAAGPGRPDATGGRESARAYFSELAAKFPMAVTLHAEFTQLTIPATPAPSGTQWLWYNLIDFDPWARLGQDIIVFGIWCDMLSPNPTPGTPATQAARGNEYGLGAAVVVGDRTLPGSGDGGGTWSVGTASIAGIDSSVTAVTDGFERRHFVRTFPSGKYTTGWNKRGVNGAIVPFVKRVTKGDRLRAGFVLNQAQALAGSTKTIDGYTSLEIYAGLTRNTRDLGDD